jgi:molecular chaperone DnaK
VSRTVGIDLGTTYTAVAAIDDYGMPVVLKNTDGQSTMPSVVFFEPPNYVVGEVALQSTLTDPERVVQFVKRFMGVKDHRVRIAGESYSPEFVSSLILRKVVQEAEFALGETIDSAVITVPAHFGEAQRHATYEAGQLAGLNVLRIINEPTAAALAYGLVNHGEPRHILVYDLGGGTFDVTIMAMDNESLQVIAVGGDAFLGGKDFDDAIMNWIEEEVQRTCDFIPVFDAALEAELRLKAEAAKRQLTGRQSVPIAFKAARPIDDARRALEPLVPVRLDLSRDKFEEFTRDLMTRTELLLDKVMHEAGLDWSDIDATLCVGGSSRMPMVRDLLTKLSGKRPLLHDPDECVAKGAAVQASLLESEGEPSISIGHVLPHSLGVAALNGDKPFVDFVVPSLTPLPCSQVRDGYTTTMDNQRTVQIRIYEGESEDIEAYSAPVGIFHLEVDPPRPKGQPDISVEFRCDENGRVTALARDADTGRESRTLISLAGERSKAEVEEESLLLAQAIVT